MEHWRGTDASSSPGIDVDQLLAALKVAKFPAIALAVEALEEVRRGVVTGEGPTTRGRAHFSRTLDAEDAALCERILIAAGGEVGAPSAAEKREFCSTFTRGGEREDDGQFDALFVKAIAHHLLAAAGNKVPPRQEPWPPRPAGFRASAANFQAIDREITTWIAARLARKRRTLAALDPIAAALVASGALPIVMSIANLLDSGRLTAAPPTGARQPPHPHPGVDRPSEIDFFGPGPQSQSPGSDTIGACSNAF